MRIRYSCALHNSFQLNNTLSMTTAYIPVPASVEFLLICDKVQAQLSRPKYGFYDP